jgi:acetamidase/formamidase
MRSFPLRSFLLASLAFSGALAAFAQKPVYPKPPRVDHYVPAKPENLAWGWLGSDVQPVYRVKSGDIVKIDTINMGRMRDDNYLEFLKEYNIPLDNPAVKDMIAARLQVPPSGLPPRTGGHMLTGPIYIEEAEPGDVLEVRIWDNEFRVPYGINGAGPGSGGLPELLTAEERFSKVYTYDYENWWANFDDNIKVPLGPFMGIMGVAPDKSVAARVGSRAPGNFGGNVDLKEMLPGSRMFIPVHVKGAFYFTGDAHAAQGDGEITGPAIETAMTTTQQFIVHKNMKLKYPWFETPTHYIVMGLNEDLDLAMKMAMQETVDWLVANKGLNKGEAYSLAAVAVSYRNTVIVNGNLGMHGMIPKSLWIKDKTPYWFFTEGKM